MANKKKTQIPPEAPQRMATKLSQEALPAKEASPKKWVAPAPIVHKGPMQQYDPRANPRERALMDMHGLNYAQVKAFEQAHGAEALPQASEKHYSLLGEIANWANKNIVGTISPSVSKWIQGGLDEMHKGYEAGMSGGKVTNPLQMLGQASAVPDWLINKGSKKIAEMTDDPTVRTIGAAVGGTAGMFAGTGLGMALTGGALAGPGAFIGGALGGLAGGLGVEATRGAAYGIHHLSNLSNNLAAVVHSAGTKYSDDN